MLLFVILVACALTASMLTLAAVALSSRLSQNERAMLRFPDEEAFPEHTHLPDTGQSTTQSL